MKRLTTAACLCAVAGMSFATVASADSGKPNNIAAKMCQAEKQADKAAFEATYGPKHAMRNCKRAHRDEGSAAAKNAAQECKAEREADPVAFEQTYGTNDNYSNAFGKCVSSKVKAAVEEDAEEFDNAAQKCRAERQADPEGFQETYGTNRNGRNAFGKCVSQRVRED